MAGNAASGGDHVLQVSRTVLIRWGAYCDHLHQAVRNTFFDIGGEAQTACRDIALDDIVQSGFIDGYAAAVEQRDLVRINIQTHYVIAQIRQACARHQTDVAGTNHSDFHCGKLSRNEVRIMPQNGRYVSGRTPAILIFPSMCMQ